MNPEREYLYGGLLGKLAFDADMTAAGHTQEEADELWRARFPEPERPSNVVYGVDFRLRTRDVT